ncbi:hypothetical protein BLAT2472_40210 [Burkholderia latens]
MRSPDSMQKRRPRGVPVAAHDLSL